MAKVKLTRSNAATFEGFTYLADESAEFAAEWTEILNAADTFRFNSQLSATVELSIAALVELASWADYEADSAEDTQDGALAAGAYKAQMLGLKNRANAAVKKGA